MVFQILACKKIVPLNLLKGIVLKKQEEKDEKFTTDYTDLHRFNCF
jgi:hypothetical protein